ncbi:20186_t:CDS:2 [Cetraspora pellucida]|uniref:20186_t:CDS:1 n=1 Tax=Cetraspora pellucida TaxID=1433469 RepID=A0A9N8VNM4_9GLOM|nr:20186_t:CDS:2 [Cetraspora pellucida]
MSFEDLLEEVLNLSMHDISVKPDSADMTFKNSLDRLTLDTLRILCNAEGLSVSGFKKELADHFALKMASKIKEKESVKLPNSFQVNEDCDNQARDRLKGNNHRFDRAQVFDQSVEFGKMLERVADDTPEKIFEEIITSNVNESNRRDKSSLQLAGNQNENKSWPEVKMDRPRDQAREIAYMRAYMLRVVNKEGWDVASALKDPASKDPLEASLKEKLMLARQSVRSKKRKTDYSSVATSSMTYPFTSQAHLNPYAQFMQPVQKSYLDQSSMPFYHTTVPQQQLPSQLSQFPSYSQMIQQFFGRQLPVQERVLQKPKLKINCSKSGMAKELLMHVKSLVFNSIGPSQRSCLNKAYDYFRKFCGWAGVAEE